MIDLKAKPFFLDDRQIAWVEEMKHKLTVKQKVGQLFCVMGGDFSLEELGEIVEEQGVGGILYRPAPAEEIRQNFKVLDKKAPVPLLKAANLEEGGAGGTTDATLFGWPMTAGATDDPDIVARFAKLTAAEGRMIGVNWTFSPVSDLDLNYANPITNVRSYGSDLHRVMRFTRIFAETMQKNGVAACAKHFPGDGVDFRDHHLHPTYNSLSAEEWYGSYGRIYQNLIEGGLMSVMVGHIVQPAVEMKKNPALKFEDCLPGSLSRELLTGVLREEFGFNGLITTDATIMGGFCMSMPRREALPAAINAGCDMVVFNTDFQEDYRYLLDAVYDGRLSEERLDEALTRILALKAAVAWEKEAPTYDEETLSHAAEWQKECADKCVTLVKNTQDVLPVTKEKYPKIRLILLGKNEISDGTVGGIAQAYLETQGFEVEIYEPYADDMHGCASLPQDRLTLYLANLEHASNQTVVRIHWCDKHALDTPRFVNEEDSVFISFSNPYNLQDVPRIRTYINAYTATKPIIESALEKVLGKSEFKGISPVDPFCGLPDTRL